MKLLDQKQISQKIKRLAIEILENNFEEKALYIGGINNNGLAFAKMLISAIKKVDTEIELNLFNIKLNPASPAENPIEIDVELTDLKTKSILVVDDVANTGRTLFYAFKPLIDILPKKIEVAVLVDRKHKKFPVKVDYMGISLATTVKENIDVRLKGSVKEVLMS